MKTCPECQNIQVDGLSVCLANAKAFANRGDSAIYPEEAARQDADAYEAEVLDILSNRLAARATSRAVLDAIAAAPGPVRILPVAGIQSSGLQQFELQNAGTSKLPSEPATVRFTPAAEDRSDGAPAGMRYDETLLHE